MRLISVFAVFLWASLACAQTPPQIAASSWLLIDYATGQALVEHMGVDGFAFTGLHRLEMQRLVVPKGVSKQAVVLGSGPEAAPAVVETLSSLGVL